MRKDWWAPLTGVAFVVVVILSFIVGGEPPNAGKPAAEIVEHYTDNKDAIFAGVILTGIGAALLVFFGAILRDALTRDVTDRNVFATVAFAGAIITAVGAAIDGTLSVALAERADEIDPAATQALQALWDNDWLPITLGNGLLLLGAGLAIVLGRALPAWLGWLGIVLGVMAFTPLGFVAFLGGAIWVIIASVLLTLERRRSTPVAPADPAGPEAVQPVGVTR